MCDVSQFINILSANHVWRFSSHSVDSLRGRPFDFMDIIWSRIFGTIGNYGIWPLDENCANVFVFFYLISARIRSARQSHRHCQYESHVCPQFQLQHQVAQSNSSNALVQNLAPSKCDDAHSFCKTYFHHHM